MNKRLNEQTLVWENESFFVRARTRDPSLRAQMMFEENRHIKVTPPNYVIHCLWSKGANNSSVFGRHTAQTRRESSTTVINTTKNSKTLGARNNISAIARYIEKHLHTFREKICK